MGNGDRIASTPAPDPGEHTMELLKNVFELQ
jgi:hypothetical protein